MGEFRTLDMRMLVELEADAIDLSFHEDEGAIEDETGDDCCSDSLAAIMFDTTQVAVWANMVTSKGDEP